MHRSTRQNITAFAAGLLLTFGVYGFLTFGEPQPAYAQSSLPLQVAPARQQVEVDPGESAAVNIRFFNLSDFPIAGYVRTADFIVSDNKGTPTIIDNADEVSPRFSGASWFTLPFDRMSIASNDKVEIQAQIKVPSDARPGGRYVAVYFEPASALGAPLGGAPEEAGASIQQRIAALVYIRVAGPVTEKALVSRIFAPAFLEYGPIDIETDILNKGDYHISPQGTITLHNMLGGFVDQVKMDRLNIFPDTQRTFEGSLGQKWMFGKYTLEVVAAYGSTGQVIKRSIDVWVFPWKVTLVVLLALAILFIAGKKMYRRLIIRESMLESEVQREHEEIKKLKQELHNRDK